MKDMTKEIVRWLSKARIPCGLNMRYMEKSQSVVLLRCKDIGEELCIFRVIALDINQMML